MTSGVEAAAAVPEPDHNDRGLAPLIGDHIVIVPAAPPVLTTGLARALVTLALRLDEVRAPTRTIDEAATRAAERYRPYRTKPRAV